MAPGCFAINQQNKEINESATKTDLSNFNITVNQHDLVDLNSNAASSTKKNLIDNNFVDLSQNCHKYNEQINLDQIPLPSTPYPSLKKEITIETNRNFLNDFNSTIDTFDLLEQTIIKQKRLARMKNTDLRLKTLLKRTFDLVCEIMDQESELEYERFSKEKDERVEKDIENEDSDSDSDSESVSSSSSSSSSDSDSDSESDSDEDSDDEEKELNKCLKAVEAKSLSHAFSETIQSELKRLEEKQSSNFDASSSKEVKQLAENTVSIQEEVNDIRTELEEHERTIFADILEINVNINEFTESDLLPLTEYKTVQTKINEKLISQSSCLDLKDNFCIPIENNLRIYSLEPSTIEIEKILFSNKRKYSHQHKDQSLKNKKLKPLVSKKRRCSNDDDDETEQELTEFDYDQE